MHKTLQIGVAATLFGLVAFAGAANSATLVLAGPSYSGNLIWNNDGTVSTVAAPAVDYTAVQQQSELFSNFTAGSSLAAGSTIALTFATVGGNDQHTISFLAPFGATAGASYTWGYTVSDTGKASEKELFADTLQTVGVSTLNKDAVSGGKTYNINFTQTGPTAVGTTSVLFPSGTTSLTVTENLKIGPLGSDASGISNSFVEGAIPEVSTWVMMLAGFAGLGLVGYRRQKASSVSA